MKTNNFGLKGPMNRGLIALSLPVLLIACGSDDPAPAPAALAAPAVADVSETQMLPLAEAIPSPVVFTNTGGKAITECTSEPELPDSLELAVTSDKNSCQVSGTLDADLTEATYMITIKNATGMDAFTVKMASPEVTTAACLPARPEDTTGYPIESIIDAGDSVRVTLATGDGTDVGAGNSASADVAATETNQPDLRLFIRGNITGWAPHEDFELKYTGMENSQEVYQAKFTAPAGDDSAMASFKISNNTKGWDVQFFVPTAITASLTNGDNNSDIFAPALMFGRDYALLDGTSGDKNNLATLTAGTEYIATFVRATGYSDVHTNAEDSAGTTAGSSPGTFCIAAAPAAAAQ